MAISDYLEEQFINHALFGVDMPTAPTDLYFSFHSVDPEDTGTNEVTSTYLSARASYSAANFSAIATNGSDRRMTNSAIVNMGTSIAASTGIPYLGIWDAVTAGNFLWTIPIQRSSGINNALIFGSGNSIQFAIGAISLSLDILKWSVYMRDMQLNWLKGTAAASAITTSYLGLHSLLQADGTGTELTTTVRAAGRAAIASAEWDALIDSVTQNTNNIDFGLSEGNASGYTKIGLWDAVTDGNLIFSGTSTAPQNIATGDPVLFTAGSIAAGFS